MADFIPSTILTVPALRVSAAASPAAAPASKQLRYRLAACHNTTGQFILSAFYACKLTCSSASIHSVQSSLCVRDVNQNVLYRNHMFVKKVLLYKLR